jgi:hypothetical protein
VGTILSPAVATVAAKVPVALSPEVRGCCNHAVEHPRANQAVAEAYDLNSVTDHVETAGLNIPAGQRQGIRRSDPGGREGGHPCTDRGVGAALPGG